MENTSINLNFFLTLLLLLVSVFISDKLMASVPDELVISYRLDSAPMQFQNKDGNADGILIDYWKLWSKKSGIPVTFKGAYSEKSQAMLTKGEIDVNAGLFSNKKREKYLDFSSPILNSPYHVYVSNQEYKETNITSLTNYRVGVTRDSFHETYMREHYPEVELALFDGYHALFKAADEGAIKAFISQPMYRTYYLLQHSLTENFRPLNPPLYTHSYKAAVAKNQLELLKVINQYMAVIEVAEKATITEKWLGIQWHTDQGKSSGRIKLDDKEIKWIAEHPVIHMGGESNWPPFDFADEKGNYQGITSNYVKLLEQRLGIRIQMHFKQSWTKTLNMLKTGKLDAVAAISKTVEREEYAIFTTPYVSYPYVIITHEKNTNLDSLQSLFDKRVAVEKDFYTHNKLRDQFPEINIIVEQSTENAIHSVSQGKADAYVGVQPVASYFMDKNFITNLRVSGEAPFKKVGISMAARVDSPVLARLLQKGLDSITADEKLFIQRKWLRPSYENSVSRRSINLSEAQKAWINSHQTIRIGVDPNWPPIEYIDNKDIYNGIASDYVRLFENTFSMKAEYDPTLKWTDVIEQIKAGKIDVLPAVSKTQEREQYLNFTKPYLRFPYVIFMRNDAELITGLDELINMTVVVEKNYANHEILKRNHPDINLLLVDNTEQALRAISFGNADAYMGNLATTSHIILQTGRTNIKVAAPTPYSNDLAFAIRKDLEELPGIIQQFLDFITVEQANRFKKKWFSIQYEHKVNYELLWNTIGVSLFILLMVSLWLWMLSKQKKALRISEERFRLVMNITQEGIWDWNIITNDVYYSPGFYSMLGYSKNDFPNKYGAWLGLLHSDDYKKTKTALKSIISNCDTHYELEFRMRHKHGEYRCVRAVGSLTLDLQGDPIRSLGSLTDITEKKNAQKKLEQREQQLKEIIDTIPLAIIIANNDGDIIFANKQTEKEIGSNESVIGLNMKLFYEKPKDREKLFKLYKDKGRVDALPMRYRTFSGEITEGIISMLPVYFDGSVKNLGVLVNLTERIQLERELVAAKVEADIANQTKSSFLANMSHEIRTPMNAVIGLGQLVLKTDLNSKQRDYVRKINLSAQALLGIINDILDFSKIEAGKLEIECIEFDLENVMENLSSLVLFRAEEKNLEILFSIEPDVPLHLLGDPLRLGQVLINLTQNAIKFTDKGEILVEVRQLRQQSDETRLEFAVTDCGVGIEQADIPHLFKAFSQVDESHTRRFGGSGLGLAICQQLVELMAGEITVKSEPGKGSRFSFQIPFKVVATEEKSLTDISFIGKRALVVDDNALARQILTSMLESFSFEVYPARSGQEALNMIRQATVLEKCSFDLVLLDWKMPGLNGIETARKIHKDIGLSHIPTVIMVTAYGREEIMHQAEQIGLDGFLIKPINPSLLFNCLMETMKGTTIQPENDKPILPDRQLTGSVLLVEDNAINQQVAQEFLENMGLLVTVVSEGAKALSVLQKMDFDIVLTDIQMPTMDGYELTRNIRDNPQWQSLPIIAMTAHAMAGDREKCLAAGMNDHIPKPINQQQLFNVLANWLPSNQSLDSDDSRINITTAEEIPDNIVGIDMAWGLRSIGGNKKLFYKLLREFAEDYATAGQQIETAISDNNLEEALQLLHTIEGIAGNIGARSLQKAAKNVTICLRNDSISEQEFRKIFLDPFIELSTNLAEWLESGDAEFKDNINQDINLDKAMVNQIDGLLVEGSPKAGEILARIDLASFNSEARKLLAVVIQNVQNFNFSSARTALSELWLLMERRKGNPDEL